MRCISFDSYIKPQLIGEYGTSSLVVYLLIPTSNHNTRAINSAIYQLYIFWFLHQTTTLTIDYVIYGCCISFDSYIKPQLLGMYEGGKVVVYLLIPTSNHNKMLIESEGTYVVYLLIPTSNHNSRLGPIDVVKLYIFWFLHQTTTFDSDELAQDCCISFDSYIKPQLAESAKLLQMVVYLLIPTSNHNLPGGFVQGVSLYIFWFLHQTTT